MLGLKTMYKNKSSEYWDNPISFYQTNNKLVEKFKLSNPNETEQKEFDKLLASLVSKKKAYEFAKYGEATVYIGFENLTLEQMSELEIPLNAQIKYNEMPDEEKKFANIEVKEKLEELISQKIQEEGANKEDEEKRNLNGKLIEEIKKLSLEEEKGVLEILQARNKK